MPRKSTGKRLRFEVFKRDSFTCQYCGSQPPDVVLVVDHIDPVASGGSNEIHNLITACEACNQGKADKLLTAHQIRPDADLLYLETQQEIAELRRYQEVLEEKEQQISLMVSRLQDLWVDWSELDWAPSDRLLRQLLGRYDADIVADAIRDVAPKVGAGYISPRGSKWIAYLHAVARNLAAGEEG